MMMMGLNNEEREEYYGSIAKASVRTYNLQSLTKILGMKLQCRSIQVITESDSQNMVSCLALRSRNFQNMKLMLHDMDIFQIYCPTDFT